MVRLTATSSSSSTSSRERPGRSFHRVRSRTRAARTSRETRRRRRRGDATYLLQRSPQHVQRRCGRRSVNPRPVRPGGVHHGADQAGAGNVAAPEQPEPERPDRPQPPLAVADGNHASCTQPSRSARAPPRAGCRSPPAPRSARARSPQESVPARHVPCGAAARAAEPESQQAHRRRPGLPRRDQRPWQRPSEGGRRGPKIVRPGRRERIPHFVGGGCGSWPSRTWFSHAVVNVSPPGGTSWEDRRASCSAQSRSCSSGGVRRRTGPAASRRRRSCSRRARWPGP